MNEASTRVSRTFGLRRNVSAEDEVATLSGGERRSVKIGRAVEFRNRVIIMDEPTNHPSVRERAHVNEIAQQPREQGLLVIYITHDIFQVHRIADRVVIMENGEKVADVKKARDDRGGAGAHHPRRRSSGQRGRGLGIRQREQAR
jgi:simple sugar transport system ATP-binding protein